MVSRTFTLGRYTCVERLGNSLLGDLWRAKRFGLAGVERQLLLTKLGATLAADTQAVGRIQAALKVYAELEHPSFLRLLDQAPGTAGSDFFWAYEFVGFANLARLRAGLELQGGEAESAALLPTVAAQLGLTLAMALGTAHERGVVHGLLTPQAVWIDAQGQPRIADLGLAAALPRATLLSDPQVKAAEKFLAPEVLSGQPLTAASDVYGLGALLTELLGNAASRVSGEAARRVQSLESIARRAQAKTPSERYTSMRDLQQALALAGGSQGSAAREALTRVGQQFLLAGDTVPQPVTISERSSAEPLPPPPTGKISIGKASAATAGGRPGATPGAKPGEPGKKSGKDGPSAAGVAQPAAASPVEPRSTQEDTPLPASRPLLMNTDPRLRAVNPAAPEPAAPEPPRTNRPSGPQRVGSGMEWLTSGAEAAAPAGSASGPNKRGSKPNPVVGGAAKGAEKRTSADVPAVVDSGVSLRSTQPGMPQKRAPGPVSINPRARFGAAPKPAPVARVTPNDGGGTWQPSANTPTADVEPPPEELEWRSEDAADVLASTARPGEYPTLGAANEPSGSDEDLLSMGATRPAMEPVRIPTPRLGMPPADARIGDEPTNQVSVDAALLAQAQRSSTAVPPNTPPPAPPGPLYSAAQPLPPGIDPNLSSSESYVLRSTGLQDQISGEPSVVAPPPEPEPDPGLDASLRPQSNRWLGLVAVASLAAIVTVLIAYKFLLGGGGKDTGALADGGPGDGGAAKVTLPAVSPNEIPLTTKPVATVFVDGKERGTAPTTLKLTPGPHKLLLVAEDYKVLRRDITAGAPLSITLEKAVLPAAASGEGVLKVKCKTKGTLRITFDGHDTGKTCPSQVEGVAPGKHTVGFLDPATDELREKAVRVKKSGKETKVSVKF